MNKKTFALIVVALGLAAISSGCSSENNSSALSGTYVLPKAENQFLIDAEEVSQSGNFVRVKLSFGQPKVEERLLRLSTLPLVFNQDAYGKFKLELKSGTKLWFDDNGNCWLGVNLGDTLRYDGKSVVRALRFVGDDFYRDEPYLELL